MTNQSPIKVFAEYAPIAKRVTPLSAIAATIAGMPVTSINGTKGIR